MRLLHAGAGVAVLAAAFVAFPGCGDDGDQATPTGVTEPIRVTSANARFVSGPLPGTPAPPVVDAGASGTEPTSDAGSVAAPLAVRTFNYASPFVGNGLSGKSISGTVSDDAVAVGVRLDDLGTGYWVVPTLVLDSTDVTAFTFSTSISFNPDVTAGIHNLRYVGIGAQGQGGPQTDLPICVGARIPDNNYLCDMTASPPGAVITLQWDRNFDLDLHVITPDGVDISPKNSYGGEIEAGSQPPTDVPHVDRDSMRNCVPDGSHQEDVIFPNGMKSGTYLVYVDPFAACGSAAVHFTYTLSESRGTCPGPTCTFGPITKKSGELLASQVTGGAGPATFVDQLDVK